MRKLAACIAAAALILGACGSGGEDGQAGDDTDWVSLLGLIPDTSDTRRQTIMEDLAGIREDLDISLPADPTDEDALADYLLAVTLGPGSGTDRSPALRAGTFMGGGSYGLTDLAAWPREVGFSVTEADADLITGRPPRDLTIFRGSVDPGAVAAAVADDPDWSADLRLLSSSGIDYWCWGDDPLAIDPERRTPFRPLGRGGCLAAVGHDLYRTIDPDAMTEALAVRTGETGSLADFDPFRLAAEALEAEGTYAIAFTADPAVFAAGALPQPPPLALTEWDALAVGAGFGDGGEYLVLVLVFPTDEAAAANAVVFEEIVATVPSLRSQDTWAAMADGPIVIEAIGRTVVAVLPGTTLSLNWTTMMWVPDTLTAWE